MNILVTGGSGYLGSHLVRTIIKNGDIPIVVDKEYPIFDVPFVQGDITDIDVLKVCFEEYQIDCVAKEWYDEDGEYLSAQLKKAKQHLEQILGE